MGKSDAELVQEILRHNSMLARSMECKQIFLHSICFNTYNARHLFSLTDIPLFPDSVIGQQNRMLPTLQSLAPGCCKCSPQMLSNVYITVQDQGCCSCGPAGSDSNGIINQCQPSSPPSSPCTPVVQAQPVAPPPPSVIVEAGPPGPPGTPGKDGVDGKPGDPGGKCGPLFLNLP